MESECTTLSVRDQEIAAHKTKTWTKTNVVKKLIALTHNSYQESRSVLTRYISADQEPLLIHIGSVRESSRRSAETKFCGSEDQVLSVGGDVVPREEKRSET